MGVIRQYYKVFHKGKAIPYYANYSLLKILWIPIRKYFSVVIIPNTPFNKIRILLYRMIGFSIGKNVFIGMKCYMDDLEPSNTVIYDNVTISYGVYFSLHGKNQSRTHICIKSKSYIGMSARLIGKKNGLTIGQGAVVGAGSIILNDVPDGEVHAGNPAKKIK